MDFEKFSKVQFESRGIDSPAARELADELQDDVAKEIHDSVLAAFLKVVEGLMHMVIVSSLTTKSASEKFPFATSELKINAP